MQVGFTENADEKLAETVMKVNYMSNMYIIKEFLPEMIKRDVGQIVTVSSLAGQSGIPMLADYSASKFASVGFTEALQMELVGRGSKVTCTIISPYFFDSGMFKGVTH